MQKIKEKIKRKIIRKIGKVYSKGSCWKWLISSQKGDHIKKHNSTEEKSWKINLLFWSPCYHEWEKKLEQKPSHGEPLLNANSHTYLGVKCRWFGSFQSRLMIQQLAKTDSFSTDDMQQFLNWTKQQLTGVCVCMCGYVFYDSIYISSVTTMTGLTIQSCH